MEYANRDVIAQGEYYMRHVKAMTAEGLHNKGDIAAELAHRDERIAALEADLAAAQAERDMWKSTAEASAQLLELQEKIRQRDKQEAEAEAAALRVDAERYRWLRVQPFDEVRDMFAFYGTEQQRDAAIGAARKESGNG